MKFQFELLRFVISIVTLRMSRVIIKLGIIFYLVVVTCHNIYFIKQQLVQAVWPILLAPLGNQHLELNQEDQLEGALLEIE
jgi:hypothetical protein